MFHFTLALEPAGQLQHTWRIGMILMIGFFDLGRAPVQLLRVEPNTGQLLVLTEKLMCWPVVHTNRDASKGLSCRAERISVV